MNAGGEEATLVVTHFSPLWLLAAADMVSEVLHC